MKNLKKQDKEWQLFQDANIAFTDKLGEYSNNISILNVRPDRELYGDVLRHGMEVIGKVVDFIELNSEFLVLNTEIHNIMGEYLRETTAKYKRINLENLKIHCVKLKVINHKYIPLLKEKSSILEEKKLFMISEKSKLYRIYSANMQ